MSGGGNPLSGGLYSAGRDHRRAGRHVGLGRCSRADAAYARGVIVRGCAALRERLASAARRAITDDLPGETATAVFDVWPPRSWTTRIRSARSSAMILRWSGRLDAACTERCTGSAKAPVRSSSCAAITDVAPIGPIG